MLGYGPTASASSTVSSPRATPTPMRWIAPSGAPNGCSRDSRCRDMPDSTRVRRLVTTCVALDAILLVLPRESLARILERHPALHERLSSGLVRRVKEAVKLALAAPRARPSEIVVLQGWTSGEERRAFVESLADALEHELGRAVAIVTVASRARSSSVAARRDRPDAVVLGEPSHRGEVRD